MSIIDVKPNSAVADSNMTVKAVAEDISGTTGKVETSELVNSVSKVEEGNLGFLVDVGVTRGENTATTANHIKIYDDARLNAGADLTVQASSGAKMDAESLYHGRFGILSGDSVYATNTLTRDVRVDVGSYVTMGSLGDINIKARTGDANRPASADEDIGKDEIATKAEVKSNGVIQIARAYADTTINSDAAVSFGTGTNVTADGNVEINADVSLYDQRTDANADSKGLGVNPHTEATTNLNNHAKVDLTASSTYVNSKLYSPDAETAKALRAQAEAETPMVYTEALDLTDEQKDAFMQQAEAETPMVYKAKYTKASQVPQKTRDALRAQAEAETPMPYKKTSVWVPHLVGGHYEDVYEEDPEKWEQNVQSNYNKLLKEVMKEQVEDTEKWSKNVQKLYDELVKPYWVPVEDQEAWQKNVKARYDELAKPYIEAIAKEQQALKTLRITSNKRSVTIAAGAEEVDSVTDSHAEGSAGGGKSYAKAKMNIDSLKQITITNTELKAADTVNVVAKNLFSNDANKHSLNVVAYAKLMAAGGAVEPIAEVVGTMRNAILSDSHSHSDVTGVRLIGKGVFHLAADPLIDIGVQMDASYKRIWKLTTWQYKKKTYDIKTSKQDDLLKMYASYGAAITVLDGGSSLPREGQAKDFGELAEQLQKSLDSKNWVDQSVGLGQVYGVWKAKADDEARVAAGNVFVTDLRYILNRDVRLDGGIDRYKLWTNAATHMDSYLLPNATKLIFSAGGKLQYVSESFDADLLGDGRARTLYMITGVNDRAVADAAVEVTSTSSLNFNTGALRVGEQDDFDLYMSEVSADWVRGMFMDDTFQFVAMEPGVLARYQEGGELPGGDVLHGLKKDETLSDEALSVYWIGRGPQDAVDADEPLYCLVIDDATDELSAWRTSLAAIENGTPMIEQSALVYRDSNSDRRGEVRYNVALVDVAEGDRARFEVITDLLAGRQMDTPAALNVVLRAVTVEGLDARVYAIQDQLYALVDGTQGNVSLLDGAYAVTVADDAFESDYIRVEGMDYDAMRITLKGGQPAWPERVTDTAAEDLNGGRYERRDGTWQAAPVENGVAA